MAEADGQRQRVRDIKQSLGLLVSNYNNATHVQSRQYCSERISWRSVSIELDPLDIHTMYTCRRHLLQTDHGTDGA